MKPLSALLVITILCASIYRVAAATSQTPAASNPVVNLRSTSDRMFPNPTSPFVVLRFPEDALGEHIGVIYYGNMATPKDGAWSIDDRFWQNEKWSSDVTSFAWAEDGSTLYVATSEVYGTGCLYRLDLMQRKAQRIYPSAAEVSKYRSQSKGFTTFILALDQQNRTLELSLQTEDGANETVVKVPLSGRGDR